MATIIRINRSSVIKNAQGSLATEDYIPNPGPVSTRHPSWRYGCYRSDAGYNYPFYVLQGQVSIDDDPDADLYTWKISGRNYYVAVISLVKKKNGFVGGRVDPNPPSGGRKRLDKKSKSKKKKKGGKSTVARIPTVKVTADGNNGYEDLELPLLIPMKIDSHTGEPHFDYPHEKKLDKNLKFYIVELKNDAGTIISAFACLK
ncbi:MAG: hypothetical protein GY751_04015 [Bacteroidetes bacterium]|nr:hypothetical protein [Bacteroidota bacterium]